MTDRPIPEPWLSFLKEIDESLDSLVLFYCFGGFAINCLYGLPRQTEDIDILSALVRDDHNKLFHLAGKGSSLHGKHKIYLDLVGAIAVVPDDYEERLIDFTPTKFRHIRLFIMEPHDIVLSKVSRNYPHDISDVEYLAKVADLNVDILRDRFSTEVAHNVIGPPERTKGNLDFLIEMIAEVRRLHRHEIR